MVSLYDKFYTDRILHNIFLVIKDIQLLTIRTFHFFHLLKQLQLKFYLSNSHFMKLRHIANYEKSTWIS
jgi:hypothetical protein